MELHYSYKNNQAYTTFLAYISQGLKEGLAPVAQTKVFCFQSDRNTDAGKSLPARLNKLNSSTISY